MARLVKLQTPAGWLDVRIADTFVERGVGLLGRTHFDDFHALLIRPCSSVHTWFMRMTIDVVFLDADARVLSVSTLAPWRMAWRRKAVSVLELGPGIAAQHGLIPGTRLEALMGTGAAS